MALVYSQNVVVYGFQQFIFLFMGKRLNAMQGVSLKLVISADEDHITSVHEVRSTKSQVFSTTQQATESSEALFPF